MATDFIIISGAGWSGHNRRAIVELSRALSASRRVLFVEPPPRAGSRSRLWQPDPDAPLWVLRPAGALPANRLPPGRLYRSVMAINRRVLARSVERARAQLGMEQFALLNAWNPAYGLSLTRRRPVRTMYYCYDDIRVAPWKSRHGPAAEEAVAAAADLVLATSPALLSRCRAFNPQSALVLNGVDFASYRAAASGPAHPLTAGTGPAVGYVGTLDHRVDVDLLVHLAKARPSQRLVLVGRVDKEAAAQLSGLPNVSQVGVVSPEEVPSVLRGLSVGLLPFAKTPFNASVYPLKLHEYMAMGLPVVSTDFAPLPQTGGLVDITDSRDGFIAGIDAALASGGAGAAARIAQASAADWPSRAAALLDLAGLP